ncbi:MAG: hypothetical protein P0S95_03660 [Rhabdochlamydiaceae bacterium]|nr:hypothetical protein [Candidatus Amphrikana amoebophyrae]
MLLLFVWIFFSSFHDITQYGYEQLQPILINNVLVKPATSDSGLCEMKYCAVKTYLDRFERPFTMIDLGANQGYYSLRAAYDFNESVFVMTEGTQIDQPMLKKQLLSICHDNDQFDNLILLTEPLNSDNLRHLGECEHFDVILAFSIFDQFKDNWKSALESILSLGSLTFIDVPKITPITPNPLRQWIVNLENFLEEYSAISVKTNHADDQVKLFLIERKKRYLKRKSWILPKMDEHSHRIYSSFTIKKLVKKAKDMLGKETQSIWHPGINLITYKMLNAQYPTHNRIKDQIYSLRSFPHGDWMINNMVVQGNYIKFIDIYDPRRGDPREVKPGIYCSDIRLKQHYQIIDLEDKLEIARRLRAGLD